MKYGILLLLLLIGPGLSTAQSPPFSGTIFIDPDIVTGDDPSAFVGVVSAGQGMRTMYDRRPGAFIQVNAWLHTASFDDGLSIEVQVNPEFGDATTALRIAEDYAWYVGQLPTALRRLVETMWIHQGVQPFGGGNNNILIHTGQSAQYIADGILEETLLHEASHSSLDPLYASAPGWLAAQSADPVFISTYARDFPDREDIAESFVPYVAARYRSDRISADLRATIEASIPNRMAFLDGLDLDMYPVTGTTTGVEDGNAVLPEGPVLDASYPNPFDSETTIRFRVPSRMVVRVSIVDTLGREVSRLVTDAALDAGLHELTWTADGLAAGVYIVRLEAGGLVQTQAVTRLP